MTIVTAIDGDYIRKLLAVYPTWARFKPELLRMPMRIIYDVDTLSPSGPRMRRLARMVRRHPDFKFVPWRGEYPTQREKMLSALVFVPAEHVATPWYLKLDADTVATRAGEWLRPEWFDGDQAFISNPWRYTKPAWFLTALNQWADSVPALAELPTPHVPREPGARRVIHPRIISWLFIGSTAWTRETAAMMPARRLPIPSQDTTLWYLAARTGTPYVTANFRRMGWGHIGGRSTGHVAERCRELLA